MNIKILFSLTLLVVILQSCDQKNRNVEKYDRKEVPKNKVQNTKIEQGNTNDFYADIKNYDISKIITTSEIEIVEDSTTIKKPEPIGFIGNDYQRFYIHFTSVAKDPDNHYNYLLQGKTKVRETIRPFKGTMTIKNASIEEDKDMYSGYKGGTAICEVKIYEDRKMSSTGTIFGTMRISYLIDKENRLKSNTLYYYADGFNNNSFEGTWTSYKTRIAKKCNWGDFRIPESGDLDIGAGEFSPNTKYFDKGWKSYKVSMSEKKEAEKWWE